VLSPIEEIKSKLDIVDVIQNYIKLQKSGSNFRALCPFHNEKTPSLFVSPEKQVWHCFGCGKGGSIFQFVMEIEGIDFTEALRMLAQKAGIELKKYDKSFYTKRARLLEINEIALNFFLDSLKKTRGGAMALKYLFNRGLKQDTINEFKIGYAPNNWHALTNLLKLKKFSDEEIISSGFGIKQIKEDLKEKNSNIYDRFRGRIMFPIFSINNEVIGFSGRILPQLEIKKDGTKEAKYINTPGTLVYEKSNVLYNLDKARVFIKEQKSCIIVEGNLDMILSYQSGVKNVVAPCGTALTIGHLKILKRYTDKIMLALDNDEAGIKSLKKAVQMCLANDIAVKIISITQGKDPADLILKDPSMWISSVQNAKEAVEFYFDIIEKTDFNNLENKKEVIKKLAWIFQSIKNPIDRSYWLKILSEKIDLPEDAISDMIDQYNQNDRDNQPEFLTFNQEKPLWRNNIEDNIIAIFLKYPDLFLKWKDILNGGDLFKSHLNQKILNNLTNNLPMEEIKDDVGRLILRAEHFFPNKDLAEKEIAFAISFLQQKTLKSKIKEITKKIKEAEKNNNFNLVLNLQDILNKILINNKNI